MTTLSLPSLQPQQSALLQTIVLAVISGQSQTERVVAQHFAATSLQSTDHAVIVGHLQHILRFYNTLQALHGQPVAADPGGFFRTYQAFLAGDFADALAALPLHIQQGCPDWLEQLGQQELGDSWAVQRAALSQAPKRFVRANRLQCDSSMLQTALKDAGISSKPVTGVADALEITSDGQLFKTTAFASGWFEQQDAGSQLVAAALPVQSGMRVVDACAGAGGKTLALAAAMRAKGRLLALDVESWKLEQLAVRAKRAGAGNIETRLIDTTKVIKRQADKADRLLLDVPCSGSGVLKRNPEAKWRAPFALAQLHQLQADILQRYSKMLCTGGELVYATCSIFPSENEQQVARFLQHNDNFEFIEQQHILPASTGFDGFYLARLKRRR